MLLRRGRLVEGAVARRPGAIGGWHRRPDRRAGTRPPGSPDPWSARDAYVDVVIGRQEAAAFAAERLDGAETPAATVTTFRALLEAQRWRLAMFASCGWFWEQPDRPEVAGAIRYATRASQLIDGVGQSGLEARLREDLAALG